MEIYREASDIYPELKQLIATSERHFVAVGVAFDDVVKPLRETILERLERRVEFTFLGLARSADFDQAARTFGQSADELKTEVESSYAALAGLRRQYPQLVHHHAIKQCPNYRLFVSDPESDHPRGLLNLYALATDSPGLPVFSIDNFRESAFASYYRDALRSVRRETNRRVFVVHGHEEAKWRELEELLRELEMEPVVLWKLAGVGDTTIEKFEKHAETCCFAIALLTPDDWVRNKGKRYFQPRPNALFELGWFCAHLGRERTLILLQGEAELPSDLYGVACLSFTKDVGELYKRIRDELEAVELLPH